MQKNIYKEDKGQNFGKWNDNISKLLYYRSTRKILSKISVPQIVADYGGANGILKQFIPNCITIDIDSSKTPDICDNILTHTGNYDLIIIRYVLHYLTDQQIISLFEHLKTFHKGAILVQQFCNKDLVLKYANSVNEQQKYFRTKEQLLSLLPKGFKIIYKTKYIVTKDFYKNRLNNLNGIEHDEEIFGIYYERF